MESSFEDMFEFGEASIVHDIRELQLGTWWPWG